MASRRKKSRPTKIAEFVEPLSDIGHSNIDQDEFSHESYEVDQAARIKRFLEEESEDTPESCLEKIKLSPVTKILGRTDKSVGINKCNITEAVDDATRLITNSYENGIITPDFQFHQLMQDGNDLTDYSNTDKVISKNSTHFKYLVALSMPGARKISSKRARVRDDDSPRYSCETCKYVTNRSDHFKRHQMTHSADKPLKCHKCNYNTGRSDHYKRHLQRHGMSEKDIVECCARIGLKLKNLPGNITSVTNKSKNANSSTTNVAKQETSFVMKHVQDVNSDSAAKYAKANSLTDVKANSGKVLFLNNTWNPPNCHTDLTDMKRFKCQSCDYTTNKKSHFSRHQLSHEKAMYTSCAKCNKSFKTQSYLHRHRCKPQRRCGQCKQIFIDHEAMLLHAAQEHPNTPQFVVNQVEETEHSTEETDSTEDQTVGNEKNCNFFKNHNDRTVTSITTLGDGDANEPMDLSKIKNKKGAITIEISGLSQSENSFNNHLDAQLDLASPLNDIPDVNSAQPKIMDIENSVNFNDMEYLATVHLENGVHSVQTTIPLQSDLTAMGNFRCTKCGAWFDKLNAYSSHFCVS